MLFSGSLMCCVFVLFFFFKQKTAYEMRISDWSSDVCSSDLMRRRSAGDAEQGVVSDFLRELRQFTARRRQDLTRGHAKGRQLAAGDTDQSGRGPHRRLARFTRRIVVTACDDRPHPAIDRERIAGTQAQFRSEERRVGKEGVRKC